MNDGWVKEVSRNQKKSGAGKYDLGAYMALVEYCQSKDKYSKPIVSEKQGKMDTSKLREERKDEIVETR
jgi:hypothetical protein